MLSNVGSLDAVRVLALVYNPTHVAIMSTIIWNLVIHATHCLPTKLQNHSGMESTITRSTIPIPTAPCARYGVGRCQEDKAKTDDTKL